MKLSDIPPTWRKHAEQQLAGAVSTKPAKAETVTGGPVKLTLPYPPSVKPTRTTGCFCNFHERTVNQKDRQ